MWTSFINRRVTRKLFFGFVSSIYQLVLDLLWVQSAFSLSVHVGYQFQWADPLLVLRLVDWFGLKSNNNCLRLDWTSRSREGSRRSWWFERCVICGSCRAHWPGVLPAVHTAAGPGTSSRAGSEPCTSNCCTSDNLPWTCCTPLWILDRKSWTFFSDGSNRHRSRLQVRSHSYRCPICRWQWPFVWSLRMIFCPRWESTFHSKRVRP